MDRDEIDSMFPVYVQYPNQSEPQPAFLSVDWETGLIEGGYNPEIGNSVPMEVYHGRVTRFRISPYLTEDQIDDLVGRYREHIDRLLEDVEFQHDRNANRVAVWSSSSLAEIDRLHEEILDDSELTASSNEELVTILTSSEEE